MRILVRKNDNVRLWCNTTSQWVSPLLSKDQMINFLVDLNSEERTYEEALTRVLRKNYSHARKLWLNKYFDSQYENLCRYSRETTREMEKYENKKD